MSKAQTLKIDANIAEPMIGSGLLGVRLPASQSALLNNARLEEIERRIILIEEQLRHMSEQ